MAVRVASWTNIVQVAVGEYYVIGLKSNGNVVAVGDNSYGQCNVGSWSGIIQVSAMRHSTIGLEASGYVVAAEMTPTASAMSVAGQELRKWQPPVFHHRFNVWWHRGGYR